MTGWAFILLVWLAGAPGPVQDASIYSHTRAECEANVKLAHERYRVGKPHPVFGIEVRGIHAECLEIDKPPEGKRT